MDDPTGLELSLGQRLGDYTLIQRLATGGMGEVWAAIHWLETDPMATLGGAHKDPPRPPFRIVALKRILGDFAGEIDYVHALRDEAQLAARLEHPNLCRVLELGLTEGLPFLVMEWIDGVSLSDLLRTPKQPDQSHSRDFVQLPHTTAATIVAQACAGLHALHELGGVEGEPLGVVHRDATPHNILISSSGVVKVSDFGVARAPERWRARTRSGELRGKLGYLAPEQVESGNCDRRTDIFALGCVLYCCVTGERPFAANYRALEAVTSGRFVPPRQRDPSLADDLAEIIERALKVDPAERYDSANDMRRALERFLVRVRGAEAYAASSEIAGLIEQRMGERVRRRNRALWAKAHEQALKW